MSKKNGSWVELEEEERYYFQKGDTEPSFAFGSLVRWWPTLGANE
jgi:hypothetical protein